MSEKDPIKSYERGESAPEQERQSVEQREKLRDDLERRAEQSRAEKGPEADVERRNAERLADSAEQLKEDTQEARPEQPEVRRSSPASKREREAAYQSIMSDAREHMSPAQRTFSKVIHNRAVESTSNAVGATVARPNAIVSGSFTAFIVVLGVFLIARYYGYPLSGSETIVAFAGGWVLGIIFDYLRALITGRH